MPCSPVNQPHQSPHQAIRQARICSNRLAEIQNAFLPVIAGTLRSTAADVELMKVEQLGALAMTVFVRVAGAGGDAKGLFSADVLVGYGKTIGRDVRADGVQSVLNDLMVANVVMRRGHGHCGLTDPFVQEIWAERSALMLAPVGKKLTGLPNLSC